MLRSAYNFDADGFSLANGVDTGDESKTQQSFKDECDINVILSRFAVTGQLPDNVRVPTFQDFEGVFDFQSSMNVVVVAREAFEAMPSNVRERFANDPGKFLSFVHDEKNYEEAVKLGLAIKRAVEQPVIPDPPVPEGA